MSMHIKLLATLSVSNFLCCCVNCFHATNVRIIIIHAMLMHIFFIAVGAFNSAVVVSSMLTVKTVHTEIVNI